MKKTFLAAAIALASFTSPIMIPVASAEISISQEDQATQTEARFKKFLNNTQQYYQLIAAAIPEVNSIEFKLENYQAAESSATAKWLINITLKDGKFIPLTFNSNIQYGQEQREADIIASIDAQLEINEALKKALNLDERKAQELVTASKYINLNMELLPDEKVKTHIAVKPFEIDNEYRTVSYGGFNLEQTTKETDQVSLISTSKGNFSSKLYEIKEKRQDGDTITSFKVDPFTGTFESDADDKSVKLDISKIDVNDVTSGENYVIGSVTMDGKNLEFDSRIAEFIGQVNYSFNDVTFVLADLPAPLEFNSITLVSDTVKDGDLYDGSLNIEVTPKTNLMAWAGIPNVNVESGNIRLNGKNLSAKTLSFLTSVDKFVSGDAVGIEDALKPVFANLHNDDVKFQAEVELKTNQGNANITFDSGLADGQSVNDAEIKQIAQGIAHKNMDSLMFTLMSKGQFVAYAQLPKAIVDATGMTPLLEAYAKNFVELKDGNYVIHVENKGKKLLINGKPFQ